jgi:hypothetical protein
MVIHFTNSSFSDNQNLGLFVFKLANDSLEEIWHSSILYSKDVDKIYFNYPIHVIFHY